MSISKMFRVITLLQIVLAARVFSRLMRTASGTWIVRTDHTTQPEDRVSVLLPVLNEVDRLEPCLTGLMAQREELAEILVIDGGSSDGTQALVARVAALDDRIRLIDASPVPHTWNGKAYGLQFGYSESNPASAWILTVDADVRPDPLLIRSLLAHAAKEGVSALSVATRQRLSGRAEALLHPALLSTLVYRFGIPGHATTKTSQVQANGQCFLVRRSILESVGAFMSVRHSLCEDVTLARKIAMTGQPVGFYESDGLVSVEMYAGWREAWANWTRSLPMRDQLANRAGDLGLAEILFVQAAPIWLALGAWKTAGRQHPVTILNIALFCARLGVLQGTARAYDNLPWTYWVSPVMDLPVALKILVMSRRKKHVWRGRPLVQGDDR